MKARKRDAARWPAEPRAADARACVAAQPPLGIASAPAAEPGNDVVRPPNPRAPRRPRASPPPADGTARVPTRTTTGEAKPARASDDHRRPRDEPRDVVVNPLPPLTPEEDEAIDRRLVALLLRTP